MKPATEMDRGEKPFITEWGVQSEPKWSPDGRKIAFVSTRTDHSFVVVYDVATRPVTYLSPSVDFDTSPMWTADSKQRDLRAAAGPAVRAAGAAGGGRHRPARTDRRLGEPAAATHGGARRGRGGRGRRSAAPAAAQGAAAGRARSAGAVNNVTWPDAGDVQGRLHAGVLEG